ncbi:MAG TPA: S8 family serine peptidase [Pirellulales bacterium]|nr:S8 family serine peptidase [Pirellulales bacterium]
MARSWLARNPRGARGREFALECLDELLFLNAAPVDVNASDWRQQTYSLGPLNLAADQAALTGPRVQDTRSLQLIQGQQVQTQFGYTGSGYSVAILDTGLDYNNPAFAGRYLGGYDFVDNTSNPMDYMGHGTLVAGIIGSAAPGHLGVAPGVGLIALKVLDNTGSGTFGNVDRALQWVIAHEQQYHIAAVNMSLGSGNYNSEPFTFLDADLQALKNEGVFIAAAAGNSYYSYGSQPGLAFPAISNLAVSVGAVWDGNYGSVSWANGAKDYSTAPDQITSFTQRGAQLDILAPGAFITSTYLNDSYASMAGTSMAAPVVAGAAVLIHQALDAHGLGGEANQDHILALMQRTGVTIVDVGHGQDNVTHTGLSFKRLDLLAAVESINGSAPAAPVAPATPVATPTPSAKPPDTPQDPNAAFVAALYQEVLGRPVDAAGSSMWTGALASGMSRSQLATILWNSVEHRGDQVTADYQTYLHRTPSAPERDHWVRVIESGVSETTVVGAFLTSGEYQSAHADNASFVKGLFHDVLGRAADESTLATWTSLLQSGTSRGDLVDAILNSTERDALVVGQNYQQFLGRMGGGGASAWGAAVARGSLSLDHVAEIILGSDEFFNRANGPGASWGQSLERSNADPVPPGQSGDVAVFGQIFPGASPLGPHSEAFHDWWLADDPAAAALDRSDDGAPLAVAPGAESLPAPLDDVALRG